jgi:hypothetical protein
MKKMKQPEAVVAALEKLGGVATLGQLYQETMKIPGCEWGTKTPFASIRRIVQLYTKDIYKIKPGLYGLIKNKAQNERNGIFVETEQNKGSKEIIEFNHSYYQGILLSIGNLKKLGTFCPSQDKNKMFLKERLDDLRTCKSVPPFSYPEFVKRSSTIDVIWFNDKQMPDSFFEVEHSTDIHNSLLKFNDLRYFFANFIVVASIERKKEYQSKMRFSAFKEIQERVKFLDYASLNKQYDSILERQTFLTLII